MCRLLPFVPLTEQMQLNCTKTQCTKNSQGKAKESNEAKSNWNFDATVRLYALTVTIYTKPFIAHKR